MDDRPEKLNKTKKLAKKQRSQPLRNVA